MVVLVRGHGVFGSDAEGLDGVGVLLPQQVSIFEVFCPRGVVLGGEFGGGLLAALEFLVVVICGVGVGAEVVVEGNVFGVNDHDVIDGGLGFGLCDTGGQESCGSGCGAHCHSARAKLHLIFRLKLNE